MGKIFLGLALGVVLPGSFVGLAKEAWESHERTHRVGLSFMALFVLGVWLALMDQAYEMPW